MLVAIFLMAILVLSLTVAAPRIKQSLERDREVEAVHRGKQYIRAIQLYYRKFHAYPPSLDALVMTDDVRFLRKKYADPITGKDDWTPILFGQNKVPTTMGFFGTPVNGTTIAGTGPGSAGIGNPAGVPSSPLPANSAPGSASPGSTGQTFGGAGIIGFSIPSERQSLLTYKKQDHFNLWEFVYDPIQEVGTRGTQGGAVTGGNPGAPGSTNGGQPSPGGPGLGTPGSPIGNPPDAGGPGNGNPPCGGTWSPNGTLPVPCPQ
jgi:type II secretory pathway pseudopilin PulG